jgi:RNA polymerase sigma factor (sigma-70 family)
LLKAVLRSDFCFFDGETMRDDSHPESVTAFGVWNQAVVTTATGISGPWPCIWLGDCNSANGDMTLILEAQLSATIGTVEFLPSCGEAWNTLYGRYCRLVQKAVGETCGCLTSERDDICQEVWLAFQTAVKKLRYDPCRGPLSSLLFRIARRVARRQLRRRQLAQYHETEAFVDSIPSLALEPAEVCRIKEVWAVLESAWASLRAETSSINYDLFCRRFFGHESLRKIAASMGLSFGTTHGRYDRTKQQLLELLRGCGEWGIAEELRSRMSPPLRRVRKKAK